MHFCNKIIEKTLLVGIIGNNYGVSNNLLTVLDFALFIQSLSKIIENTRVGVKRQRSKNNDALN